MEDFLLEEKRTTHGELFGFTIDWRLSEKWNNYNEIVKPLIQKSKREGLFVLTYRNHPFF
jgi:glycine cleavage system regulatory protein